MATYAEMMNFFVAMVCSVADNEVTHEMNKEGDISDD